MGLRTGALGMCKELGFSPQHYESKQTWLVGCSRLMTRSTRPAIMMVSRTSPATLFDRSYRIQVDHRKLDMLSAFPVHIHICLHLNSHQQVTSFVLFSFCSKELYSRNYKFIELKANNTYFP